MKSGIYRIRNKIDGKEYIGSSVYIVRRLSEHKRKLRNDRHHSEHLQNAFNKYGEGAFVFEVIKLLPVDRIRIIEGLLLSHTRVCERPFGYNLHLNADGSCPSLATREKMSKAKKGVRHSHYKSAGARANASEAANRRWESVEERAKASETLRGHFVSEETKVKLSKALLRLWKNPEYRDKLSAAFKQRWAKTRNVPGTVPDLIEW